MLYNFCETTLVPVRTGIGMKNELNKDESASFFDLKFILRVAIRKLQIYTSICLKTLLMYCGYLAS